MKRYKEYMDGVLASDTLHQRLAELEAPAKTPALWKKYGTVAAALALVVGLGAWGLGRFDWNALAANYQPDAIPEVTDPGQPDTAPGENQYQIETALTPDIGLERPGYNEPGEENLGGYDVTTGNGPTAMVTHYVLPYIEYGEVAWSTGLDWDIPAGAARRQLTQEEITALLGGEDALSTHLDWGEYNLYGWAAWYEDGSFWGAYVYGKTMSYNSTDVDQIEFAVTAGQLPPTCIAYAESVTQVVRGLNVTADGYDFEQTSTRRISFLKGDYGYRFEVGSNRDDCAQYTELLASRLVRQVADQGLNLSVLGGTNDDSFRGNGLDGNSEASSPADNTAAMTPPYNPDAGGQTNSYTPQGAADPYYSAPSTYDCGICGQSIPVGVEHSHAPGTYYTCPNCGETVLDGAAHYHEDGYICSGYPTPAPAESVAVYEYPMAPGAHICEVCGQSIPNGVQHSHSGEHHSSHHGGHH